LTYLQSHLGLVYIKWFKWPKSDFFLSCGTGHDRWTCKQEKTHGFRFSQIGFRPHSYVVA